MPKKISPVILPQDLITLTQAEEIVLIDASAGSKARYDENHLARALYIDLNTDLAHIDDFNVGGRHPLPTIAEFSKVLGRFGISKNSRIVIYDDKSGGNAAARFWWMLKAIGHDKVQVLSGGFQAAVRAGFKTNNKVEIAKALEPDQITGWQLPLADIDEVERVSKSVGDLVIDVRDANRFAGLTEPIDLIAGHIPGAINIPFTENLDDDGLFLSPEILKEKYSIAFGNLKPERVIVHCGSGVTACHTLLAIDYAGLPMPKLYVGSWSEWSRNNKEMVLAKK